MIRRPTFSYALKSIDKNNKACVEFMKYNSLITYFAMFLFYNFIMTLSFKRNHNHCFKDFQKFTVHTQNLRKRVYLHLRRTFAAQQKNIPLASTNLFQLLQRLTKSKSILKQRKLALRI